MASVRVQGSGVWTMRVVDREGITVWSTEYASTNTDRLHLTLVVIVNKYIK